MAKTPKRYLNTKQFADRIGVKDPTLSGYDLPKEDCTIGPVNDDGTLPRGTSRGWTEDTIDRWAATRVTRNRRK